MSKARLKRPDSPQRCAQVAPAVLAAADPRAPSGAGSLRARKQACSQIISEAERLALASQSPVVVPLLLLLLLLLLSPNPGGARARAAPLRHHQAQALE